MLIEAVENNSLDCVKLLVDFGESVDKRDREGRCALNFACKNNNLEMVEYLYSRCDPSLYLGHESFPADSGEFDSSPLHWCAQYNSDDKNLNCIEFFLRNGFTNIDCLAYSEEHGMKICPKKKYKFFTPLALSIYNGTYYLTRYLIKQGASVRPLNADVYPPLIAGKLQLF